jgi:hypothetical protein
MSLVTLGLFYNIRLDPTICCRYRGVAKHTWASVRGRLRREYVDRKDAALSIDRGVSSEPDVHIAEGIDSRPVHMWSLRGAMKQIGGWVVTVLSGGTSLKLVVSCRWSG